MLKVQGAGVLKMLKVQVGRRDEGAPLSRARGRHGA
jgi:hypothetical protein